MGQGDVRHYSALAALAMIVMAHPDCALAQAEQPMAAGFDDIVVTAQRREERLQDVPIAISAFNPDTLTSRGIRTTADLRVLVPSLNYTVHAGAARPYLRGIGNNLSGLGAENEIGTYQDGVAVTNVYGTALSLFAVERVEVLAGPQGTLYGRNTTGGAINVITRTPGQKTEAEANIGYGNYNRVEGSALLSGPLSETVSAGVYAAGMFSDHYNKPIIPYDERLTDFIGADDEHNWGVRGKLVLDTGPIRLVGTVEHSQSEGNWFMSRRPITPRTLAFVSYGQPYINVPFHTASSSEDGQRVKQTAAYLNGEFDLGFARLVSITSWRKADTWQGADQDGTAAPLFWASAHQTSRTYTQELQLQSNAGDKFTWVLGAYGFDDRQRFDPNQIGSSVLFTGVVGPGTAIQLLEANLRAKAWAVFAQGTYPLTDDLKLTVGGRYSHDSKSVSGRQWFSMLVDRQAGPPVTPIRDFDAIPDANWSKFTPKAVLDYKPGNTLFYASYSQGYKAGAYNTGSLASPGPANPETLSAYEVGTKGDYMDGALRFNTAFYYYDFKDLQLSVLDPARGAIFFLNAGAAKAYGVDLTLSAKLGSRLTVDLGASLEHITYASFKNAPAFAPSPTGFTSIFIDASDNRVTYAPEYAFTGALNHVTNFANGGQLQLNTNFYFNGGFYFDAANTIKQPGYFLIGASAKYSFPGERWALELYASNLTNEHYYSGYTQTNISLTAADAEPRLYGARLSWKY